MGSLLYDYLTESALFDINSIDNDFHNVSDKDLLLALRNYRDYCQNYLSDIVQETNETKSNLKVFSSLNQTPLELLKGGSLYVHQFILNDPLVPFCYTKTKGSEIFGEYLGFKKNDVVDRKALADTIRYLRDLTPMISADYVKMFPFDIPSETEEIPVYAPSNYYADELDGNILKWFHDRTDVRSLKRSDAGWIIEKTLYPSRGIIILHKGHDSQHNKIAYLIEPHIEAYDESASAFKVRMILPAEPPNPSLFDAWVFQEMNKCAIERYQITYRENLISAWCGAKYLTSSPFIAELIRTQFPLSGDKSEYKLTNVEEVNFSINLPTIQDVSVDNIMRVRTEDGEAFENFRSELDRIIQTAHLESDPNKAQQALDLSIKQLYETSIPKIENKAKNLKRGILIDIAIATASLAGSCQTGGLSLLSSAAFALHGIKTWRDYRSQLRENPAFFLWKLHTAK